MPEHEARQRGVDDARGGSFNQRMANDPLNGPPYRGGFAEGQRVHGIHEQIRRWYDGPAGVPPAGVPPPDPGRVDYTEYKVGPDDALHAYQCPDPGGCAGCSPIGDNEARHRGYRAGAHRGPVDGTLVVNRRHGRAYLDGLREGRADALANAGWPEARAAFDAEREAAYLAYRAAQLTSDGYPTPAKEQTAEDLLHAADRLREDARTLLDATTAEELTVDAAQQRERAEARSAQPATEQAARDARQRELEDNVLADAGRLDPADRSLEAEQLRATAASILDHQEMAAQRDVWAAADDLGVTASPTPEQDSLGHANMTRTQYLEAQAAYLRTDERQALADVTADDPGVDEKAETEMETGEPAADVPTAAQLCTAVQRATEAVAHMAAQQERVTTAQVEEEPAPTGRQRRTPARALIPNPQRRDRNP